MLNKASTFRVGLFLLVGILLGVGTIIWLGASHFFQKTNRYAIYFNESVSGLSVNSKVKYRGVAIGRVEEINVAPDGRLIEVLVRIDPRIEITPDIRAQLKQAGITGIRYIELTRLEPSAVASAPPPHLPFPTPAPVIPSQPSALGQFFGYLDQVGERLNKLDLEGVVEGIKEAVRSVQLLVANPKWERMISQLDSVTSQLAFLVSDLRTLTEDPHLKSALKNMDALLVEVRDLAREARSEVAALDLGNRVAATLGRVDRVAERMDRFVYGWDARSQLLQRRLERITREMESMFRNLNDLSETLKEQPSELIFSAPPRERHRQGE